MPLVDLTHGDRGDPSRVSGLCGGWDCQLGCFHLGVSFRCGRLSCGSALRRVKVGGLGAPQCGHRLVLADARGSSLVGGDRLGVDPQLRQERLRGGQQDDGRDARDEGDVSGD